MSTEIPTNYLSVNDYLNTLNEGLINFAGRVIGEVTDIQEYPGRSYLFFKIKDKDNPAVLSCFMWKNDYTVSGLKLEVGLEIIVSGTPSVFKPLGRLSLNTKTIELVGEGALRKAYIELKARLEKEGIFSEARKRPIPLLPQKIGLITSKDGAVIGDFQVNIGRFGFKITFVDSRVEGQLAVPELLDAIKTLKNKDIEVLVLIRGGGSLESLLPFNNEALVREVVNFPVPVLVGVGHEKDISLIGLAADRMVSTPTAAAQALNESWQQAITQVQLDQQNIFSIFSRALITQQTTVQKNFQNIYNQFQSIFDDFYKVQETLSRVIISLLSQTAELYRNLSEYPNVLKRGMWALLKRTGLHISEILRFPLQQLEDHIQTNKRSISSIERFLRINNPEYQLRLGYSIVRSQGSIIRSVDKIKRGQSVEVRVQDGSFKSDITEINKVI